MRLPKVILSKHQSDFKQVCGGGGDGGVVVVVMVML